MKFKSFFKLSALTLLVPSFSTLGFLISSCSKPTPPPPIKSVAIIEPEEKAEEGDITEEGTARASFKRFSYEGFIDETKLQVSGDFSYEDAQFEYSISNFDSLSKTFNVLIHIQNAQVVEHLIGKFTFIYDDKPIKTDQSDFDLSINPIKAITLPENKKSTTRIASGKATTKFKSFSFSGIKDISKVVARFTGEPTIGKIEKTEITKTSSNTFDVALHFSDVSAETINGCFEFWYESSKINVPTDNFTCVLEREEGKPSFHDSSWWTIISLANDGLESLQSYFGQSSFVGETHTIKIEIDDGEATPHYQDYTVRVIGQNQDHFASGLPVALTFQFDSVVSENVDLFNQNEIKYEVVTKYWDDDDEYRWFDPKKPRWCSIERYLNTTFMYKMDITVSRYIKPVQKTTFDGDSSEYDPDFIDSKDYIWCLSPSEMGLAPDLSNKRLIYDEGECYQYYLPCYGEEESSLRLATDVISGEPVTHWCRSPYYYCDNKGAVAIRYGHPLALRPCFCI